MDTTARSAAVARTQSQPEPLSAWLPQERERAIRWMLENISPAGAAKGSVCASQQRENPNYWYHWVRDAGLTMKVIANLYRRLTQDFQRARTPAERHKIGVEKGRYFAILLDYAKLSRRHQTSGAIAGLGEPKFEMDGSRFDGPWGRPQNDSPAARAVALTHFAQTLLLEHRDDLVREWLYRDELPANTVVKADLEYVAQHWSDVSFDAWEEVAAKSHFYNAMVQRRALLDGAHLADALSDFGAARFYRQQAKLIEAQLERHWSEELGLFVPSLNSAGQPGQDSGLDYKDARIDSVVLIGVVRGDTADGFMLPDDDRVLSTAVKQEEAFRALYPINQRPGVPGLGIGRYPEDRWFGGNPWMISTLAFSELYFLIARKARERGELKITARGLPFWRALPLPAGVALKAGETILREDPRFAKLQAALHAKADGYLQRVRYHTGADGSWAEEMDRETGVKVSAEKLTWNSAAYLRVLDNRREVDDLDVMVPPSSARLGYPITTALDTIHFVFEGAGDVVRRYWGPALLKLRKAYPDRRVKVTLLDVSAAWKGDKAREAKGRSMLKQFQDSDFGYFDKSAYKDPKKLDEALKALRPDAVVVANPDFLHVATVRDWLRRYGERPPQLFVEKPFSNSSEDAFMLLGALAAQRPNQVHLVDHFRAMSLMTGEKRARLLQHLGGLIDSFRFWLVEDHSGADPRYQSVIPEDGAIEREGRAGTLKEGLIYDLMPHMFAAADLVGDVLAFNPRWIRAAQYVGVGGDPDARPRIPADAETFADIGFDFRMREGAPIHGRCVVGKGLRGVKELGPAFDHEVFAWEAAGEGGRKALFNLRADGPGAGRAHLLNREGQAVDSFELSTDQPYFPLVESIFNGVYLMNRVTMTPHFGFALLQIMDDLRLPIKRLGQPLPTYQGGMRNGQQSAYVEDLASIKPVWGAEK